MLSQTQLSPRLLLSVSGHDVVLQEVKGLREVILRDRNAVIGRHAAYLVGPVHDGKTILYADIDLECIIEEKQTLDVVRHYARPEVLSPCINRSEMTSVASHKGEEGN